CIGTVVGAAGGVAVGVGVVGVVMVPVVSGTVALVPPGPGVVEPGAGTAGLPGTAVVPAPACAPAVPASPNTVRLATNWAFLLNSIAPSVSKVSRPVVLERESAAAVDLGLLPLLSGHRPGRHKVSRRTRRPVFLSGNTGLFV